MEEKRNILQYMSADMLEQFPQMNAEYVVNRLMSSDDIEQEMSTIVTEFHQVASALWF